MNAQRPEWSVGNYCPAHKDEPGHFPVLTPNQAVARVYGAAHQREWPCLVAAAPDLLKAVQAVAACNCNEEDYKNPEWQADVQRAINRCVAVLRKLNRTTRKGAQ